MFFRNALHTITPCLIFICASLLTNRGFASYSFKDRELKVRTTAYTHTESDHRAYRNKTALGTTLKYSQNYTSAASDWSRYPVGTEFRIRGLNRHFVIDDYGRALVGCDTIDLYFPSKAEMNRWGVQNVDIIITKYGDFEKSREILSQRVDHEHCLQMLTDIEANFQKGRPEFYQAMPSVPTEINPVLMTAASVPKKDWNRPAPEIPTETINKPVRLPAKNASHPYQPIRKQRQFRPILSKP